MVFWITGLSGAGKTTIGKLLYESLNKKHIKSVFLDGDILRDAFGGDLGYEEEDRHKCAKRYSGICKILAEQNINVIICTISMYDEVREWNRANIKDYFEVYIRVSMETLFSRNQKNLYKNHKGLVRPDVVGIKGVFEEPKSPDMIIDNDGSVSLIDAVGSIITCSGINNKSDAVIFSQRVDMIESYNEKRDSVDQRIVDFIIECGGVPVPIPNRPDLVRPFVDDCKPSAIVLTGGNSLVKYGGDAPERDETEKLLLDEAIKKDIPVLGICRGMQLILNYFGYPLVKVENHVAKRHKIRLDGEMIEVNSYHNLACVDKNGGGDLKILAKSEDGVIESVEHNKYRIKGIMWHPERETSFRSSDLLILKSLLEGH